MSDIELINKAAGRIYPTHLNEDQDPNFSSWESVLPSSLKSGFKGSVGHVQKSLRNSHTLTHKFDDGHSLEVNLTTGKNHIAVVKMGKGARTFTAIHSNEDPQKAIQTAYDAVRSRSLKEETEITLIEKMEKRIEKKTGKLSDKKEKIDVEPSEEKELKESTPPGMESWVKKNKARFVKEYGEKKGHEVLYATAWKLHNKMNEMEELNELSKKTLASYVKKSNRSSFELGYDAASNEFHDDGDYKKTQKDEKKALKRQRFVSKAVDKLAEEELKEGTIEVIPHFIGVMPDGRKVSPFSAGIHHVEKTGKWTWGVTDHNGNYTTGMSRKPVESKEEAIRIAHEVAAKTLHRVKLSESTHTYTKEGLAKQIKYHENRAAHHDSEAQASFNKAQDLTGDKADLHFNAAKGHKAIADLHRKHIYDLKSSVGMNEAELNELSPHTLGMYTKIASIDMGSHRAHSAISHRAQIDAETRGSKESAKAHEENKIQHDKKATKRLNGIIKATNKLVRKAVVKEEQLEETRAVPHPDKVVMTSGIRKDLGGGYMAKTRNGHFYKLNGVALPKLGTVLDTSKHKFIGKDKVDLNLLKEHIGNETDSLKNYIHTHPILGRFNGKEEKYYHKEDGDVRAFHEPNGKHVLIYSKKTTPYGATHKATIYYKRAENEPMLPQTRKFVGHEPDHVLHAVAHEFTPIKEDLDHGPNDIEIDTAAAIHPALSNKMILKEHINESLIDEPHHVNSAKIVQNHPELNRIFNKQEALGNKLTVFRSDNGLHLYSYEAPNIKNRSKIYHSFIHDDNTGKSSEVARESGHEHSIHAAWKRYKKHLNEDLDHDHPDMKAYHAACKARDEAHLASIRYRMNHDIKQPEHRAKYDELEAEHHRLRDIEDQASEKVHGRLFAHHAGFKE